MTSTAFATTAILSALPQEQRGLLERLHQPHKTTHAGRDFWQGSFNGQPVVLALSKIGKVAAATTATTLIERFGASRMVFTGVAGGLGAGVNVGDVVVSSGFVQHDMDASPLFPRYEVPLYGQTCFAADAALGQLLHKAAENAFATNGVSPYPDARVHRGLICSGDRFVSGAAESRALLAALTAVGQPVLAVEMEGAAVAQVCHDYGVPFAAVRTISDRADDSAHVDFVDFVNQVAGPCACAIIDGVFRQG